MPVPVPVRSTPRPRSPVDRPTDGGEARARLRDALDRVRAGCEVQDRLSVDPVGVVHRYERREDQELVALMASAVAFGNVKALRAKLEDALARLGPRVAQIAEDEHDVMARLLGWKHRVYRGEDLGRLLVGARRVQHASGSLGARFRRDLEEHGELRAALVAFTAALREAGGFSRPARSADAAPTAIAARTRGAAHILADPSGASACKRLLLFLRWMIREADGVDLGLWSVPASVLLIPVDTHIHKLSRNLGFTRRKDLSWKTAVEITDALRAFDPSDPTKYDFALCHLGMLQRCPSRKDPERCRGCAVLPVCRHWSGDPPRKMRPPRKSRATPPRPSAAAEDPGFSSPRPRARALTLGTAAKP